MYKTLGGIMMKKIKKVIVTVLAMTMMMSVGAFAATAAESLATVKAKLAEAKVPATYSDQIATYLTANPLTQAQADSLLTNVDTIKATVGDKTKAADFTTAELLQLKTLVDTTASSVGLTVTSNGTDFVIKNAAGETVGTSTIAQLKEDAKGIDKVALKEAIVAAQEYAQAVKAGDAVAPAQAMKHTATNNGNVLVLGLGVLAIAGTIYAVSKKVTA